MTSESNRPSPSQEADGLQPGHGIPWPTHLQLRPGEWVEVRSKKEILATLNKRGRKGSMPFMPEMLKYCGQRFRVAKRAEKSCDTARSGRGRRLYHTVHLEGVRCDGSAHDGCQALCLIWWHEAWLRRVDGPDAPATEVTYELDPACTERDLARATRLGPQFVSAVVYSCQNTELPLFSQELAWWSPKALGREILRGNVSAAVASKVVTLAALNILRRLAGRPQKPSIDGRCAGKTPSGSHQGLKPGDWVRIKSKEEIERTLNPTQKNRGLFFDIEMLPYCGRRMRLLERVERIIDEKRGIMLELPNDCWTIEGAVCEGYQSRDRLFCTRQIQSFWREIWFEPAPAPVMEESRSTSAAGH